MNEMKFEVGDRVWSFEDNVWVTVVDIEKVYPDTVRVCFDNEPNRWILRPKRFLFFEEIVIPPSARTRPKPKHEFTPGDVVCVRGNGITQWHVRAFTGYEHGMFKARVSEPGASLGDGYWPECVPYDRTLLGFDAVEEKNDE